MAKTKSVIVLQKDLTVDMSKLYTLDRAVNLTLDLNQKKIVSDAGGEVSKKALITMTAGALTIKNGTMSTTGASHHLILLSGGADLTVEFGDFSAANGFVIAATGSGSDCTINGGTYSSGFSESTILMVGGKLTINNGTIVNTSTVKDTELAGKGACVTIGDKDVADDVSSSATITNGQLISKKYGIFQSKNSSLEMNGGSITLTDVGQGIGGNSAYIGATATINNVTINAESDGSTGIYLSNAKTLTINGGTYNIMGNCVELKTGKVTINGGSFNAKGTKAASEEFGGSVGSGDAILVIGNKGYTATKGVDLTINGGSFESLSQHALYAMSDGDVTNAPVTIKINGGTFKGKDASIARASTSVSVVIDKLESAAPAVAAGSYTLGDSSYIMDGGAKIVRGLAGVMAELGVTDSTLVKWTAADTRLPAETKLSVSYEFGTEELKTFATANDLSLSVAIKDGQDSAIKEDGSATASPITVTSNKPEGTGVLVCSINGLKDGEKKSSELAITVIPNITQETKLSEVKLLATSLETNLKLQSQEIEVDSRYIIDGVDLDTLDNTSFAIKDVVVRDAASKAVVKPVSTVFAASDDGKGTLTITPAVDVPAKGTYKLQIEYTYQYATESPETLAVIPVTVVVKDTAAKFTVKQVASIDVYYNDVDEVEGTYTYASVPLTLSDNIEAITDVTLDTSKRNKNPNAVYKIEDGVLTVSSSTPLEKGSDYITFTVKLKGGYADVTDPKLAKLTVKLVESKPTVKLKASSGFVIRNTEGDPSHSVTVQLVSSSKKFLLEDIGITDVSLVGEVTDITAEYDEDTYEVTIKDERAPEAQLSSTKLSLEVAFKNTAKTLQLPYTLKTKTLAVKLKTSSVTLNLAGSEKAVRIPLTLNPVDETAELLGDVTPPAEGMNGLTFEVEGNNLVITATSDTVVTKNAKGKATSFSYKLQFKNEVNSKGVQVVKTVKVKVVEDTVKLKLGKSSVTLNTRLSTDLEKANVLMTFSDGSTYDPSIAPELLDVNGNPSELFECALLDDNSNMMVINCTDSVKVAPGSYALYVDPGEDYGIVRDPVTKLPKLTIKVVDSAIKMSAKISGKLDVLNPESTVNAKVSFSGTSINSAKLFPSQMAVEDFELTSFSGSELPIEIKDYNPDTATLTLGWIDSAAITENGTGKILFNIDCNNEEIFATPATTQAKPTTKLTIAPVQSSVKITAVSPTLYKSMRYMSSPITFKLSNPDVSIARIEYPVAKRIPAAQTHYDLVSVGDEYELRYTPTGASWVQSQRKNKTESLKVSVWLEGAIKAISVTIKVVNNVN